jgi:hypothetical protein
VVIGRAVIFRIATADSSLVRVVLSAYLVIAASKKCREWQGDEDEHT